MDVQQVEAFLAVADELHFGRAAERLVQSRPRVSKLIASLEREVGGALFDRTSRRVRLTPLGTRFRDQLRPGYTQMQAALADARAAATEASGVLRVGFTVTTGGEALTRLVTVFEVSASRLPGDPKRGRYRRPVRAAAPRRDRHARQLARRQPARPHGRPGDRPLRPGLGRRRGPRTCQPAVGHRPRTSPTWRWPGYRRPCPAPCTTPCSRRALPLAGPSAARHQVQGLHHTLALVASNRMVHLTVASLPLAQRADITLIPITGLPPLLLGLIWCTTHENARIRALAQTAATQR